MLKEQCETVRLEVWAKNPRHRKVQKRYLRLSEKTSQLKSKNTELKNKTVNFYVITGGPGVGKTTLLNELNKFGFLTVPEDARRIIKEQIQINGNGLPWRNKEIYGHLMLNASVKAYRDIKSKQREQVVFFDRGILDTFCYFEMENIPISKEIKEIAIKNPYNKKVFILPPWREIYETDTERKQTWEEAKFTFNKMKEIYLKYNYDVIEVPKQSIENRQKFILDNLKLK